jgi:high-affinity Fe2+/Pb2+ permease
VTEPARPEPEEPSGPQLTALALLTALGAISALAVYRLLNELFFGRADTAEWIFGLVAVPVLVLVLRALARMVNTAP